MATYSDDEQVQMIREWWEKNGTAIVVTILVAVVALLGWRQWQSASAEKAEAASVVYQQMMDAFEQAQAIPDSAAEQVRVRESATRLVEDYGNTAYGDFARMMLARLAVEEGNYETAATHLRDVIGSPAGDILRWTATMRLARILIQTGDHAGALALLDGVPQAFLGQALELRGDALLASGDAAGARAAWEAALEHLDGDAHRDLVQMKLDDLAAAS